MNTDIHSICLPLVKLFLNKIKGITLVAKLKSGQNKSQYHHMLSGLNIDLFALVSVVALQCFACF